MHAERDEQLAEVGLDVEGVTRAALALARAVGMSIPELAGEGADGTASPSGRSGDPGRQAGRSACDSLSLPAVRCPDHTGIRVSELRTTDKEGLMSPRTPPTPEPAPARSAAPPGAPPAPGSAW